MTDESARTFSISVKAKLVLAIVGVAYLCACAAPTRTQTSGTVKLDLAADGRIVVYPSFGCLSEKLAKKIDPPSIVMSTAAFQDAMYPWFEPAHAPKSAESLSRLVAKPHVRAKIDDLKLRFLIGLTQANEGSGFPGFFCGAGYGGAGCLGVGWENKQTSLNAVIWDFREKRESGSFSVKTSGTSLMIGVGLPIVFIASTEDEACRKVADVIVDGLALSSRR